jgi:hypothetical protein
MGLRTKINELNDIAIQINRNISLSGHASQDSVYMHSLQVEAMLLMVQANLTIAEAILELRKD